MKVITILGSGRSGTSLLVDLLNSNGVYIGRNDISWGAAPKSAPTFENLKVRSLNDEYLQKHYNAVGRSGKPYGDLPDGEIKVDNMYKASATNYINAFKKEAQSSHSWWDETNYLLFKDPRTTVLHDMWMDNIDIIIGIFRNPVEVVNSYMKLLGVYYENNWEEGQSIMLNYWKRYNQSLLHVFNNTDKEKYMFNFNGNIENQADELIDKLDMNRKKYIFNNDLVHNKSDSIFGSAVVAMHCS